MALVKHGGGVVQMSGSIGGNTFARNRFGNYVRARTRPVNPNTTQQGLVRTAMSFLTVLWSSTLTASERTAWGTYAAAISMKNRLGESVYLTGFNHFIRSNTEYYRHMLAYITAGPTVLSLPEKDIAFAVSGSAATQNLSIVFTEGTEWTKEAGARMFIYMGTPRLATRNFFNGPWKFAGYLTGVADPGVQSPGTIAAPMTLVEGQLVTCYARIWRMDGRISEPFSASFTVAA